MPSLFFFFNDTATTEIYTLSLHDALPISALGEADRDDLGCGLSMRAGHRLGLHGGEGRWGAPDALRRARVGGLQYQDRESTRLNSSHSQISYAVFCLKKKRRLASRLPSRV